MTTATAPGKLILCGEHAVVYGYPAIALPLPDVCARVQVEPAPPRSGLHIFAKDLDREWIVNTNTKDPLDELIVATLHCLGVSTNDLTVTITSDIPIAGGMGSGAAVATALVQALTCYLGCSLTPNDVSSLVYSCEQRYHGTPSGIDNTVIAFNQPIWFVRASQEHADSLPSPTITPISIANPFTLLIGDTGVRSKTHLPVGAVRRRWQADPTTYAAIFDQVGAVVTQIQQTLQAGETAALGLLLNTNQALLEQMGVSSPELERLITAARNAGALGAKLSGAGWGGVMLALVEPAQAQSVAAALRQAGAARVMETQIAQTSPMA